LAEDRARFLEPDIRFPLLTVFSTISADEPEKSPFCIKQDLRFLNEKCKIAEKNVSIVS
jgi:hypothetical protein